MRCAYLRVKVLVALALLAMCSAGAARAQPARSEEAPQLYRPFVFIEIEERHQDLAPEGAAGPSGKRMVLPYVFDSRRGILRPTPEVEGEDFLQGKSLIVLHRIVYEGQRRGASYWVLHRFNDLPAEIDLQSVPEKHNIELSADEQNRSVRPITLSWGKGKTPVLRVEYGEESIDLAIGQRWTPRPFWLPAVFSGLKRPVHVASGVSVRFWGMVRYCPFADQRREVELLLPLLAERRSTSHNSYFELVSIGDAAVPGLVRMIESKDTEVRQLALNCLDALCAREAVPDIIRLLDSPKWVIASSAASTLGGLADTRAVEPLLKLLQESENDDLVGEAASALGAIGDKRATPALKELLADANPKRKLAGAGGLGFMGKEDGLELARKVSQGDDRVAIRHSLDALWIIGGKDAHSALLDFAGRHEGESVGKDALLFVKLVAARQGSALERRRVLGDVLAGKGVKRLYAAYEIEQLDMPEALAIYRDQIERIESEGDWEGLGALFRALLWRLVARKAWREYDTKAGGETP